jgi:hypothetical protein
LSLLGNARNDRSWAHTDGCGDAAIGSLSEQ